MDANRTRDPIPEEFNDIKAAAEFWDTHSLADYWDQTEEVQFDVSLQRRVFLVPLEHSLARRLADVARRQGVSAETLVNLWVSDHLRQAAG
jgi:hypothetical protein